MDASVLRAMARWPDVPDVFGWLRLDRRGRWLIRDQVVTHHGINAFIRRNYAVDEQGRWYFQNGPQRVFVTLDYTPLIYCLGGDLRLETFLGENVIGPRRALIDEDGNLLLETEHGIGLLLDRDLPALIDCFEDERGEPAPCDELLFQDTDRLITLRIGAFLLPVTTIHSQECPATFGYIRDPQPD